MSTIHELLMPELAELRIAELRAEADAYRLAKSGEPKARRRFTWTGLKLLDRRPKQAHRPAKAT